MDKIKFHSGGFPLYTDTLKFMQKSYEDAIQVFSTIGADGNYILSGCKPIEGTNKISDGYLVLNGEVLPFKESEIANNVKIKHENADTDFPERNVQYADSMNGSTKESYFYRVAVLTDNLTFIDHSLYTNKNIKNEVKCPAFNEFKRLDQIFTIQTNLHKHKTSEYNKQSNNYPHGITRETLEVNNLPNAISDSVNENDSKKLATSKAVYGAYTSLRESIGDHSRRNDNPHKVNKEQLGLDKVDNVKQVSHVNNTSLNNDLTNTRGVTRLYSNNDTDQSIRMCEDTIPTLGSVLKLRAYNDDNYNGKVFVDYADKALEVNWSNIKHIPNLDHYSYWRLNLNDGASAININSREVLNLRGGKNISISNSSNNLTISATEVGVPSTGGTFDGDVTFKGKVTVDNENSVLKVSSISTKRILLNCWGRNGDKNESLSTVSETELDAKNSSYFSLLPGCKNTKIKITGGTTGQIIYLFNRDDTKANSIAINESLLSDKSYSLQGGECLTLICDNHPKNAGDGTNNKRSWVIVSSCDQDW